MLRFLRAHETFIHPDAIGAVIDVNLAWRYRPGVAMSPSVAGGDVISGHKTWLSLAPITSDESSPCTVDIQNNITGKSFPIFQGHNWRNIARVLLRTQTGIHGLRYDVTRLPTHVWLTDAQTRKHTHTPQGLTILCKSRGFTRSIPRVETSIRPVLAATSSREKFRRRVSRSAASCITRDLSPKQYVVSRGLSMRELR